MKNAHANLVEKKTKPAEKRIRHAEALAAKPAHRKVVRQAAFLEVARSLPVAEAVSRARLIPEVNPVDFRIIRMPG